jgi:hypothetical protein
MRPKIEKMRPMGEISPNLVTLTKLAAVLTLLLL